MHIGIAGVVDVAMLLPLLPAGTVIPPHYPFPLISQIALELHRRGHRVSVFGLSAQLHQPWVARGERINVHLLPMRPQRAAYDFYQRERALLTPVMRESGCDVLHAHWCYEFAAAALDSGRPTLVTCHDSPAAILPYFLLSRAGPFWMARCWLGARTIRRAPWLSTVSEYCRQHIRQTLRPRGHFSVVPNGITPDWLEAGRQRLKQGEPPGPFTIATVLQGFGSRKNSKRALQAFALLRQRVPDARLVMFGHGHGEGEEASRWAHRHGLGGGVEFRGARTHPEVQAFLCGQAHVLLHPSREESFGMAPLEAMACGVAAVGGQSSGAVPEVIGDPELLTSVDHPAAIARVLYRLAMNPAWRAEKAHRGWQRAHATYPFHRIVDGYEALYPTVIAAPHGGGS